MISWLSVVYIEAGSSRSTAAFCPITNVSVPSVTLDVAEQAVIKVTVTNDKNPIADFFTGLSLPYFPFPDG
jgi:hypothetical protein